MAKKKLTKKQPQNVLRFATAATLMTGIFLVFGGSGMRMKAQLSGHGSTVMTNMTTEAETMLHGAAADPALANVAAAQQNLVIGILLILTGFLLHALMTERGERTVRVKEVPRKSPKKAKKEELFWMHVRV